MTQRLHWALIPHKYRHVLGWYRLIGELNENEVKVICVFDGKERSVAKALEVCPIEFDTTYFSSLKRWSGDGTPDKFLRLEERSNLNAICASRN